MRVQTDTGCHIWTGAIKTSGYGCISINKKVHYAHRLAYEQTNGPIPDGLVIDHTCHRKACVNPAHMQAVTTKQNSENVGKPARAASGYRGVHFHNQRNQFVARVRHNGQMFHGGYFDSAEDANAAAIELRNRLFTNNLLDTARCAELS